MNSPTTAVVPVADGTAVRQGRFVLSRPHGTVSALGRSRPFDDARHAAAALKSGELTALVGALPFDRRHPAALMEPESLVRSGAIWQPEPSTPSLPRFDADVERDLDHLDRVRTAVGVLSDPSSALEKVVLARRVTAVSSTPVDAFSVLAALVAGTPAGNGYLVDLGAAGGEYTGRTLVGSSPEVLVRRRGRVVTCHPLAGSAARHPDAEQDWASASSLTRSTKDLREHAFVVDALRDTLAPFCRTLDIPKNPTLTHTPQLWHLGTPITGELRDESTTALELALAVHPTPAICGTPTDLAYDTIHELEGDRGFYAGSVGWCDADGDGEWMVTIRCAEISSDGRRITAYAGGGIVAESEPQVELIETNTKFGTVLGALGVSL